MKYRTLVKRTLTPEMAAEFGREIGVLRTTPPNCPKCTRRMHVERGKHRQGLNGRYRCSSRTCRSSLPLTTQSFFEDSHVQLDVAFDIIYQYVERKTIKNAAYNSDVSESTIKRWYKNLRTKIRSYIEPYVLYRILLTMAIRMRWMNATYIQTKTIKVVFLQE
jgi:transposase-like protein